MKSLILVIFIFLGVTGCGKEKFELVESLVEEIEHPIDQEKLDNSFIGVIELGQVVIESDVEDVKIETENDQIEIVEMPYIPLEFKEELVEPRQLIALTFDDGPSRYTTYLLDALKEREAKATFFILGSRVEAYRDIVLRMGVEGHEVGSHSFNHPSFHDVTRDEIFSQIKVTGDLIESVIGIFPTLLRPPYGRYNEITTEITRDLGISIMLWDIDPYDWKFREIEAVRDHILSAAVHGSVILLHDIYETSVLAAVESIDILLEKGFEFVTVSELFEYEGYELEAGEVYWGLPAAE